MQQVKILLTRFNCRAFLIHSLPFTAWFTVDPQKQIPEKSNVTGAAGWPARGTTGC